MVSVVVGFLQSLVPATPGNIEATFLRLVYEDLHDLTDKMLPQTKQSYFCAMNLSVSSRLCLKWWMDALILGLSKQYQPTDMATLRIRWADGSDTVAGGTFNLASPYTITDVVQLDIWKGIWSLPVLTFISNWK